MNIKNFIKKIADWYYNLAFLKKIIYVYLVCAILPIFAMLLFNYKNTLNLLLEQTYSDIKQTTVTTVNSLNIALQPYSTVIQRLKNDKNLNTQLNVDYDSFSYADLSDYIENDLDPLKANYPYITGIIFYSSNDTLPDDHNYFYSLKDMDPVYKKALEDSDNTIVVVKEAEQEKTAVSETDGQKTDDRKTDSQEADDQKAAGDSEADDSGIVMLSAMNYYGSQKTKNYIMLQFSEEFLNDLLVVENSARSRYLVSEEGTIIWSSDNEYVGKAMKDLCPSFEDMEEDTIVTAADSDGRSRIYMKSAVSTGLEFLEEGDREAILSETRNTPLVFLIVMLVITIVLFQLMVLSSRMQEKRLQGIIANMEKIGSGDFSEKLEPKGNAEFGQIESAVNQMSEHIDDLIQKNYRNQLAIQSTELNLLQEQINPHFLYNALGVISSLSIRERAKSTTTSIRYLADFYRISLNKGRSSIHISEEIDLLRNYMQIQLLRFSDLVEIFYETDPAADDYYTIKLLLQPLVENAIHHAREEETFLTIKVRSSLQGDRVCFDVEDNGMGIEPEKLEVLREQLARQEEGFGLKNVDKRIKLAYGQEYGLTIFSEYGKGTRIHLEIPVNKERESRVSTE